ncbi:hypothetical protein Nepgr_025303 [Nepenthes gracilis]|uniref:Uncharacterized protein n=1 Tax=Nepenthes gracilis TaxID=150966 RepID=A0AAD3Y0X7_NEPGR|nr:hypothetical protein Nepgr_025303 [Nepenthes gracilis]
MGCGASRLDHGQQSVPPRLRLILRCRLEELRRRRNPTTTRGATLSKKELLQADGAEHEDDNSSISHSDSHSSEENEAPNTALECCDLQKRSCERKILKPEGDAKGREFDGRSEEDKENNAEKIGEREGGNDGNKLEAEEDENVVNEGAISACPSSPSFRVYCSQPMSDDEDDDDHNDNEAKVAEDQRCPVRDEESTNSNEVSVKKPANNNKGRKGRRFRKVAFIPKAGKNLWNVRGCYTPRSSDSTLLLEDAAA